MTMKISGKKNYMEIVMNGRNLFSLVVFGNIYFFVDVWKYVREPMSFTNEPT